MRSRRAISIHRRSQYTSNQQSLSGSSSAIWIKSANDKDDSNSSFNNDHKSNNIESSSDDCTLDTSSTTYHSLSSSPVSLGSFPSSSSSSPTSVSSGRRHSPVHSLQDHFLPSSLSSSPLASSPILGSLSWNYSSSPGSSSSRSLNNNFSGSLNDIPSPITTRSRKNSQVSPQSVTKSRDMVKIQGMVLSRDDLSVLEQIFDIFDTDGDGLIAIGDLYTILKRFEYNITEYSLRQMVRELGQDNSNSITLPDFIRFLNHGAKDTPQENELITSQPVGSPRRSLLPPLIRHKNLSIESGHQIPILPNILSKRNGSSTSTTSQPKEPMTRERKGSFLSRLFRKAVPQPPVQEDVVPQDFGISNEDEKERTCDSTPEKKREMYEVFQMFDVHNTGSIGLQEVKNITEKLGIASALSDQEVRSLLATVDDDNDGKITFDEFYLLFNEC